MKKVDKVLVVDGLSSYVFENLTFRGHLTSTRSKMFQGIKTIVVSLTLTRRGLYLGGARSELENIDTPLYFYTPIRQKSGGVYYRQQEV